MQAASCRNLFRWTCEIAEWNGLKWDEVTFEVKFLFMVNFRIQVYHTFFPHHHHLEHKYIYLWWRRSSSSFLFHLCMKEYKKKYCEEKGRNDNEPEYKIENGHSLCHTELLVAARSLFPITKFIVVFAVFDKIQIISQNRINYRAAATILLSYGCLFLIWDYISTLFLFFQMKLVLWAVFSFLALLLLIS